MKIKRYMTGEEFELFNRDIDEFIKRENKKIVDCAKGHYTLKMFSAGIINVFISGREILAEIDVKTSDTPIETKDMDAYEMQEDETEIDMDPLSADKSTGGYRLTAFLPGIEEGEIKIDVRDGVLALCAGKYRKEFNVPKSVCEIRKTYRNGVLDIRLV